MAKRDSNAVFIAACIVYITAMINQQLIYFSAVEIYNLSYIHLHYHHLLRAYYELTMWPLPVGLIAQLVEYCTGNAELMGRIPSGLNFFFQALFHYCV